MEMNDANSVNIMDSELRALEERVDQLAQLVRRLRSENNALRDSTTVAHSENASLRVKVESATQRLQRLLERLPEEAA